MNPQGPRRATLAFIFVTVALQVVALGLIIPVLPKLIEDFMGGDTARGAKMVGLFGTTWALIQFICSPFLGALSDRFGRRPVILLSSFGLGFDYILMAVAPNMAWLFAGRLISGITAASFGTAGAYVADVTPPEKRAAGFGLIGAAWGIGFVLGPALGGILGVVHPRLPFWVAAGLTLVNALYGLFVLPESLPAERRAPLTWTRANPLGSLKLLRAHPGLLGLSLIYFLFFLAHQVLPSVFVLYTGHRYGWNARDVGLSLGAVGICNVIVQAGLVKRVVGRFGERKTLLAGLLFGIAGLSIYGLAREGWMLWAGIPIFSMWGLLGPSLQGLMTKRVPPTAQGHLQGVNTSIMGITGIIGPGLFTLTFAHFLKESGAYLPGAPFFLAAGFLAIAFAWSLRAARPAPAVTP